MLLVKTKLGQSRIHGVGLFADQFIPSGTVLWRYGDQVDRKLTAAQIDALPGPCAEQMRRYTYRERSSGLYVLCGDDARFFNHTKTPNCIDTEDDKNEGLTVAIADIQPGDELTCDYGLFDMDWIEGKYRL